MNSTPFTVKALFTDVQISTLWDGRLGCIGSAKKRFESNSQHLLSVSSVIQRTARKARHLEMTEVDKLIGINVIEPAQKESESVIVLAPKDSGLLHLCIYYNKLNGVSVKDALQILRM